MAGPIRISILANGKQARAEAAATAGSLGVISKGASRASKALGAAFAIGTLGAVAVKVGKIGSSYVDSINKVQALTGATDREIASISSRLESQASSFAKYGQTTGQAAEGLVELTKSGLSAQKSLNAVRGTMTLAKAGELEVAAASELVANTLNTFNLRAGKAADLANSLANAANISSADVRDVAESFKYVAPLAAKANISVDQTNAVLAQLANSGIKASQAGTTFRKFLLSLQTPTGAAKAAIEGLGVSVYDAEGKMRPLESLIGQLQQGLSGLSQQQQNKTLRDIFGMTGVTGAQVILEGGVKGLREYTKGVKRAGAAAELAESASKGLTGTLKSIKSEATSGAQALYRRFSPALDSRLQSVASWVGDNRDELASMAKTVTSRVVPAVKSLSEFAGDLAGDLKSTAAPLAKELLPALEAGADLAVGAAKALNDIPGPVREIALQAGLAALVLPKLTTAVTIAGGAIRNTAIYTQVLALEMKTAETRSRSLQAAMTRLSGVARAAAGIGGLVALTKSASETNKGLQSLGSVGGGALLGFSVGGPIGAAIGGTAGALLSMKRSSDRAKESMIQSKLPAADYASALDEITGAATRAVWSVARLDLQRRGAFEAATALGLSNRDVIAASLGQRDALERVNAALKETATVSGITVDAFGNISATLEGSASPAAQKLSEVLGIVADDLEKDRREVRATALETKRLGDVFKGLPKTAITDIRTNGVPTTLAQVATLRRRYDLTPKQVRTLIRATGISATVGDVMRLKRRIEDLGKTRVDMKPAEQSMRQYAIDAKRRAMEAALGISDNLQRGTRKAKADLKPFGASVRTELAPIKGLAATGGQQTGSGLGHGIYSGLDGWAGSIAAKAGAIVRAAVTAAKAAGEVHSPSKKMDREVGQPLGQGILLGLEKAVTRGSRGIDSALDKLTRIIEKRLDGKKHGKRRKTLLNSLRDERRELVANGKAQERNTQQTEKATRALKDRLRVSKEFAKSLRDGYSSYGSVVGLGTTGSGSAVTASAMLSQLTARAEVAGRFSEVIERLRKRLNKTSLRQILDTAAQGDLEGALATATAIDSGGKKTIKEINKLTANISKAGGKLGDKMSKQFYSAGIQAAKGVVAGLETEGRKLDRVAERLAKTLVSRVKKALKIKSPSRVFADIGVQTSKGLQGGLLSQNTYVQRSAAAMAAATVKGYGTPVLDYMRSGGSVAAGGNVQITLNVTAPVGASASDIGRDIVKHVDHYFRAGGRPQVRWA